MVSTYATEDDLETFLGTAYSMPVDVDRVLKRASEVVAEATFWRSEGVWFEVDESNPADTYTDALRDATCAQVEFWMESGEEFDVSNVSGSVAVGRVQVHRLPPKLSLRAARFLRQAGLLTSMVQIAP